MKFRTETLYLIETNNGTIGFDLIATDNMKRVELMYDDFKRAENKLKSDEVLIEKKNNNNKNQYGMKVRDRDTVKAMNDFINSCVKALDRFFGEGAGDKIFYEPVLSRVIINQDKLEQLINELLPKEFEKAGLKMDSILETRTSKENRERFNSQAKEVKKLD